MSLVLILSILAICLVVFLVIMCRRGRHRSPLFVRLVSRLCPPRGAGKSVNMGKSLSSVWSEKYNMFIPAGVDADEYARSKKMAPPPSPSVQSTPEVSRRTTLPPSGVTSSPGYVDLFNSPSPPTDRQSSSAPPPTSSAPPPSSPPLPTFSAPFQPFVPFGTPSNPSSATASTFSPGPSTFSPGPSPAFSPNTASGDSTTGYAAPTFEFLSIPATVSEGEEDEDYDSILKTGVEGDNDDDDGFALDYVDELGIDSESGGKGVELDD